MGEPLGADGLTRKLWAPLDELPRDRPADDGDCLPETADIVPFSFSAGRRIGVCRQRFGGDPPFLAVPLHFDYLDQLPYRRQVDFPHPVCPRARQWRVRVIAVD